MGTVVRHGNTGNVPVTTGVTESRAPTKGVRCRRNCQNRKQNNRSQIAYADINGDDVAGVATTGGSWLRVTCQ